MSDSELYYDHPDPAATASPAASPPRATPRSSGDRVVGNAPHRSSTLGSAYDLDRRRTAAQPHPDLVPHARSEDLNHGHSASRLRTVADGYGPSPLATALDKDGFERLAPYAFVNQHQHGISPVDGRPEATPLSRSNSADTTATSQSVSTVTGRFVPVSRRK
jgi:hypothetical protein